MKVKSTFVPRGVGPVSASNAKTRVDERVFLSAPAFEKVRDALLVGAPDAKKKSYAAQNEKKLPEVKLRFARDSGPRGELARLAIVRTVEAMEGKSERRNLLSLAREILETHLPIESGEADSLVGKPKAVVKERRAMSRALLAELAHEIWTQTPIEEALAASPYEVSELFTPSSKEAGEQLDALIEAASFRGEVQEAFERVHAAVDEGLGLSAMEKKLLLSAQRRVGSDPDGALATLTKGGYLSRVEAFEEDPGSKKAWPKATKAQLKEIRARFYEAEESAPDPKEMVKASKLRLRALVESVEDEPPPTEAERYSGALVALAVGDALGGPTEFMDKAEIRETHGLVVDMVGGGWLDLDEGETTDDTDMAVSMAESIVAKKGLDQNDLTSRWVAWLNGDPKDVGIQTRRALELAKAGVEPAAAGRIPWILGGYESAGNGSVMRAAPVALLTAKRPVSEIASAAMVASEPTHADPRCLYGAVAISLAVSQLIKGEADVIGKVVAYLKDKEPTLAQAIAAVPKMKLSQVKTTGYVVDTVQAAFWALHHAKSLPEGLVTITNLGGDTDTAGATAGILLGAKFGLRGIPADWREDLVGEGSLSGLATQIHGLATG